MGAGSSDGTASCCIHGGGGGAGLMPEIMTGMSFQAEIGSKTSFQKYDRIWKYRRDSRTPEFNTPGRYHVFPFCRVRSPVHATRSVTLRNP